MAVNATKIRMGAPDAMTLFGSIDVGASQGGCELTYTPTNFKVMIDQAFMPAKVFRAEEEFNFKVGVAEYTARNLLATMGYTPTGVVTTATGSLGAPGIPVLAVVGTAGAVTYSYTWVAFCSNGDSIPSAVGTTAVGPTTLGALNYITVQPPAAVTGAVGYRLIRTVGGTSQGLIGTWYGTPPVVSDTGLAATAYTPAAVAPAYPNSDRANFGGGILTTPGSWDWSVPKQDGTTCRLRGHFNLVWSAKAVKIDYKRDKNTDLVALELQALADLTQPAGQQGGWLTEEY